MYASIFKKIMRVLFQKIKMFQENIEYGQFLNGDVSMKSVRPWPDIKD